MASKGLGSGELKSEGWGSWIRGSGKLGIGGIVVRGLGLEDWGPKS